MNLRQVLASFFALLTLSCCAYALPSVVDVADSCVEEESSASLFSEESVVLDIGTKKSESNVRYVEIDGVQTLLSGNDSTYAVKSDKNVLVEITEKTSDETFSVLKSQYFYVDAKAKKAEKLSVLDNYMQSYDKKSIRTAGEKGLRFKAHATTAAKTEKEKLVIDEYGYLVTTKQKLGENNLTLDSERYVKGIGYSREQNINIVFDATNDAYDVFTLVLKNIPVKNYGTEIVCKTYTKVSVYGQQFVVYGESMSGNVYDIAKKSFVADCSNNDIAAMVFDYAAFAGVNDELFGGYVVSSDIALNNCTVTGTIANNGSSDKKYNVYLATYNEYGTMLSVRKSSDLTLKAGLNSFEVSFALSSSEKQTKAYVFTSSGEFAGCEEKGNWQITEKSFYDALGSSSFSTAGGFFNPDSNVSNIEAVALVSHIHAKYNNKEVASSAEEYSFTLEMDDADMIVDLSERNSRNDDKINFARATGGIDEEAGYLYGQTDMSEGKKDPQVVINGLNLDARRYNKITLRMKYENVPGDNTNLTAQVLEVFFKTNFTSAIVAEHSIRRSITSSDIAKGWFEVELDASGKDDWKDVITGIRVDPANCNLKFYIDYITFSQSEKTSNDTWYDKYLDYAHENSIIKLGKFKKDELTADVSRKDLVFMFLDAFPESAFTPINNISAIPDIDKNDKNADFYLMLYKSGLTLGFDDDGNLGLKSPITRTQLADFANRMFVPSKRLRGTVNASWEDGDYKHDLEFNSVDDMNWFGDYRKINNMSVKDGYFSFRAHTWDSYMIATPVSIDADLYSKIKIRIKAEFDAPPEANGRDVNIYFRNKNYNGQPESSVASFRVTDAYLDSFGWYVFEIDMFSVPNWEDEITYFRFDPMNAVGNYTLDYIRFIKSPYGELPTQADLIKAGYTAKQLMPGTFKNGFLVSKVDQSVNWQDMQKRKWSFPESDGEPVWTIGPWHQGTGEGFELIDLWDNRIISNNGYTIADSFGANTITYNPELDSITQRLNATKIYNGKPHYIDKYRWWPHQLFDTNQNFTEKVDMEYSSADADRIFVELDIRMLDFKPTTNTEGMNVCSYLAYFYLRCKDVPSQKIWFGLALFSGSNLNASGQIQANWAPDSAAHQYMYGIPQAVVYDGIKNSFNPTKGVAVVGEEWKHIRLDVTPHIDRAIEWANRDNAFGFEVEKEDMFFNGVNIGYEIHGNFDVTFEIKNLNMIAYNKPE